MPSKEFYIASKSDPSEKVTVKNVFKQKDPNMQFKSVMYANREEL